MLASSFNHVSCRHIEVYWRIAKDSVRRGCATDAPSIVNVHQDQESLRSNWEKFKLGAT